MIGGIVFRVGLGGGEIDMTCVRRFRSRSVPVGDVYHAGAGFSSMVKRDDVECAISATISGGGLLPNASRFRRGPDASRETIAATDRALEDNRPEIKTKTVGEQGGAIFK